MQVTKSSQEHTDRELVNRDTDQVDSHMFAIDVSCLLNASSDVVARMTYAISRQTCMYQISSKV